MTIGSRGDAQPCAALALALTTRGHSVRLVAPDAFENLVAGNAIEFVPLGVNVLAEAQNRDTQLLFEHGGSLSSYAIWLTRVIRKVAWAVAPKALEGARGADVIVGATFGEPLAAIAAEYFGAPCVHVWPYPSIASRDFLCSLTPPLPFVLPKWLNKNLFALGDRVVWLMVRGWMQEIRRGYGMRPEGYASAFQRAVNSGETVLFPYSEHLLPRSSDWPPNVQVTGYWTLEQAPSWTPPAALEAFLSEGTPPVYVGFGSMQIKDREATFQMALNSLRAAGVRAVFAAGWSGLQHQKRASDVFFIDEAPHDWLFDRVAAVVHHGGAGTTGAALRAGKPSVVAPFILDQFFWGDQLRKHGLAPAPLRFSRLTSAALAAAIRQAVSDMDMRAKAEAIGRAVRAEDGLGQAVAAIEATARRAR